jgi:hypothetical protein
MTLSIAQRLTAPFTIFFRNTTGDGGYVCHCCGASRAATFERMNDAFAVANQHLALCRGALRGRPVEGSAVIDGNRYGVVLHQGLMIVALDSVFRSSPKPVRIVA